MRGTLPVLQAHQQLLFGRRSFWPHAEPSLVAHLQPARRPCGGLQSRPGGLLVLSSISPERTQRHPSFPLNSNSAFANSGNANNIVEALAVEKFVRTTSRNGNGAESSSRLRVAVDVDEVLGQFLHSLNQFCLEELGLSYQIKDYSVYDFAKIWNCSQEESNTIVHNFFKSRHFSCGIQPLPGALETLQELSKCCDLVVVTSRQHVIQGCTMKWLDEHFPGVFSDVYFGNHWAMEGPSKRKSDICREVGASVLIDDNPAYAVECAMVGIHVLLYDWEGLYPWSKTADGPVHPRIERVRDWQEVEAAIQEHVRQHHSPPVGYPAGVSHSHHFYGYPQ